jgi:hypothetical protein
MHNNGEPKLLKNNKYVPMQWLGTSNLQKHNINDMSLVFNRGITFCGYPIELENCIQELESSEP